MVQDGEQPGRPRHPVGRTVVEELRQVVEVGHVPVAVELTEHAGDHARLGPDRGQHLGHRTDREFRRPRRQSLLQHGEILVGGAGHVVRRPGDEPGQRMRPHPADVRGPFHRRQEEAHLFRRPGSQDAAGAGDHRRYAFPTEGGLRAPGVFGRGHQDGDVRRPEAARPVGGVGGGDRCRVEELTDMGDEILFDQPGRPGDGRLPVGAGHRRSDRQAETQTRDLAAPDCRHPLGGVGRRGFHPVVGDGPVPERHAVEQRVDGVDRRPVRPPVGTQGESVIGGGGPDRVEVHGDVGPPEAVDRLFGVTHQDEGPMGGRPPEEGREDLPLDPVGVLELIDEHHLEPVTEGVDDGGRGGVAQHVAELGEDVVEAHPARVPQQGRQIGLRRQHELVETHLLRLRPGRPRGRLEHEVGATDVLLGGLHQAGQRRQFGDGNAPGGRRGQRIRAGVPHQIGHVRRQPAVGVDGGGHAQGVPDLGGETVDRRDRRRVEFGDGPVEPGPAGRDVAGRQERRELVVLGDRPFRQGRRRPHQLAADARPQLGGGRPGERDHQQFRGGDVPFGEEPRRQRRQRVRLARPGAGLDDHLPVRQPTEDVEVATGHGRSTDVDRTVPHSRSA